MRALLAGCLLLLISSIEQCSAVKKHDFKTCEQSGFCRRNRALADRAATHSKEWASPYRVVRPTFNAGTLSAHISNALFPAIDFSLEIRFQEDGVVRLLVDEVNGLRQRYNEAAVWTLVQEPRLAQRAGDFDVQITPDTTSITYDGGNLQAVLQHNPLKLVFYKHGTPHITLNGHGLFNMEHFRLKKIGEEPDLVMQSDTSAEAVARHNATEEFPHFLDTTEDGMWEESFGSHRDSKPKGPESLSLDIQFEGYEHVFGIPQHSGPLSLKTTRGGDNAFDDPYRLFNLDVFEYEHDSPMSIYGSIPYMQAHRAGSTVAVFWLNAAETWIDIEKPTTDSDILKKFKKPRTRSATKEGDQGPQSHSVKTHWMSESGVLDLFIFLGASHTQPEVQGTDLLFKQFTDLVGRTAMPQYFAIGYHQCRWNYLSQEDVLTVSSKFDEYDMPMDVMWLDIEYATDHKYFIWNRDNFPEPEKMQEGLAARGRKLVAIIDPHIKRVDDLYVYKEARDLDILVKKSDGAEFEGWCWTGSSSWVDFFNPKSWDWWAGMFKYSKFIGSTPNLFVWNDMNEPAVFNGPEITMPKDNIHHGGWENRDIHNINGIIFQNLTSRALRERDTKSKRPFVLSRAFWAGSQRFGAIWTGDNLGNWEHLAVSSPMVLANGIGGMAFNGADVGGFFGNPSEELLVRWYQIGAFYPFFRGHAHIDTRRREPYLFDDPTRHLIREALRLRYSLLPLWYTAFWDSSRTGVPILSPQYIAHPTDEQAFAIDDQFYIGHDKTLLLKPVLKAELKEVTIHLSDAEPMYDYLSGRLFKGPGKVVYPVTLDSVPLLQRGGSILTRRDLIRRSAPLMWRDPITLVVALDSTDRASGTIYTDDGESYDYESGSYVWRQFRFEPQEGKKFVLTNMDLARHSDNAWSISSRPVLIDTIIVLGLANKPGCVRSLGAESGLPFHWTPGSSSSLRGNAHSSNMTIEGAGLPLTAVWSLEVLSDSCAIRQSLDSSTSPSLHASNFRCENIGHQAATILASRVNDGICDPECCDGSDEFDGKVNCPNRCAEIGAQYRKEQDEILRKYRVGGKLRDEYIKYGLQEKQKAEKALDQLRGSLNTLEEQSKSLEQVLREVESRDAAELARKKQSRLYKRLEEHQAAIKSLRQNKIDLKADIEVLTRILGDLQKGYNPNYQDMAVKGAVKGFEEWQKDHGLAIESDLGSESTETPLEEGSGSTTADESAQASAAADEFSDEVLVDFAEEDVLSLIEAGDVSSVQYQTVVNLFKLEDYLPTSVRGHYKAAAQSLVNLLQTIGVINVPQASSSGDRPDIVHARDASQKAKNEFESAQRKISEHEKELARDWGKDREWRKLDGTCIDKNTGEYTYEVCFFGGAKQKSNNGHMQTNLGKFTSWHPSAPKGSKEYYDRQVYSGGQKCWNGPERSAIVDITCGTKNELLSIVEPEKCEYHFKITSPAACWPIEEIETIIKDEL